VHQHVLPPAQLQERSEPQPGSTGVFVTLHSAFSPPPPEQAGAPVQHVPPLQIVPLVHLLQV
jgi:hypothetical protein